MDLAPQDRAALEQIFAKRLAAQADTLKMYQRHNAPLLPRIHGTLPKPYSGNSDGDMFGGGGSFGSFGGGGGGFGGFGGGGGTFGGGGGSPYSSGTFGGGGSFISGSGTLGASPKIKVKPKMLSTFSFPCGIMLILC